MRKLFALICGAILLFGVQIANAADIKFAVIDLKKILSDAPPVIEARTKINNQFEPRNKEMLKMQKNLQADMDKYTKDSAVMKDVEKKDLQNKILDQQKKLRDKQEEFQKELVTVEEESMKVISQQIQDAVDGVSKTKGFDMVIAKGAVAYSSSNVVDVTDDVLKQFKDKK